MLSRWLVKTGPRWRKARGISDWARTTLLNWVRKAEKDDIPRPSLSQADMSELRELRRRNKLLEQEA